MTGISFTHRLTNILTNRLFLNIRAERHLQADRSFRSIDVPEPVYAQNRLLGNLGGPIEHGWLEAQFDEDVSDNDFREGELEDTAEPGARDATVTLVPVVCARSFIL